jgi:hypothetical protein
MPATISKEVKQPVETRSVYRRTLSNTAIILDKEYQFIFSKDISSVLFSKLNKEIKRIETTESYTSNEVLEIQKKALKIISKIIELYSFEKMSIELTNEDSIVYTMIQNNYTCFIEEFFDDKDCEELVLSIFESKKLVTSFTGNLDHLISEVKVSLSL